MSLAQRFQQSSFPNQDELIKLIKPGLQLDIQPIEIAQQQVGNSRIGGIPDLPDYIEWPFFEGQPHAFVAQINLGEIPDFSGRKLLPDTGLLYFFFEPTHDFGRLLPPESQQFTVFFLDKPVANLAPRKPPDTLAARWHFRNSEVKFVVKETFPRLSIDPLSGSFYDYVAPLDVRFDISEFVYDAMPRGHRMLSHSRPVEGTFESECEHRRLRNAHPELDRNEFSEIFPQGVKNWELLLCVPSDGRLRIEWVGDLPIIYFMIHHQDLQTRNFAQTWLGFESA
jgi:uncharacterized protein YwqG